MRLTADNRAGIHNQEIEVLDVDEEQALNWLRKLDGRRHTLLCLDRKDGWQLMVGGGPTQYVITLNNGLTNLTFLNPEGNETEVFGVCAGGQYGEFPKNICATYTQASRVIALFFANSERHANWR